MPRIIAETEDVLVIDKPAGLIAHRDGRTVEPSVAEWLIQNYPELETVGEPWVSPQGESVPVAGMVHRLDRTTSGVMLVAKTTEVYAYLKNEFKERRIEKVYRAFVYGHTEKDAGKIVAEIMRSTEPPKKWFARACEEDDVRAAITEWKVLKKFKDGDTPVSFLELYPKTGRTHQIRVHLAFIDHPIIADHIYAPDRPALLGFTRPALHAHSISVILGGERTTFIAPALSMFTGTL